MKFKGCDLLKDINKKDRFEFDIHLKGNGKGCNIKIDAANEDALLTAIAIFINEIKEKTNIDIDELEFACNLGLKKKSKNIKVNTAYVTKDNAEDITKLINKLI